MHTYGAQQLAGAFRTVRKNTIQVAEDIPETRYDFAAAPETRTVAQMLVHIAVAPRIWLDIHSKGLTTLVGYDFMSVFEKMRAEEAAPRSKAEIVALLRDEGEKFATFLESLSDSALDEMVTDPMGESKSRLERLLGAKEHEMHHRAQLMLIERMVGVVPHLTRQMQERMAQQTAAAKS